MTMKEVKEWGLGRVRAGDRGGTLTFSGPEHCGLRRPGVPVSCTRSPGSLGLGPRAEKEAPAWYLPRHGDGTTHSGSQGGLGRGGEDAIRTGQKPPPCLWRQVGSLKVWTGGTCERPWRNGRANTAASSGPTELPPQMPQAKALSLRARCPLPP